MEESLKCSKCSKKWSRIKVRGRKPLLCPSCLSIENGSSLSKTKITSKNKPVKSSSKQAKKISPSSSSVENNSSQQPSGLKSSPLSVAQIMRNCHPKPPNYKELQESTKDGSIWKCKNCGHIWKLLISISDIPLHRCTPDMVSLKIYERIS